MIRANTKHDQELANRIWKAFKPTLTEKHGATGSMGKEGEEAALTLIESHPEFDDVKYAISHEDALHQMLGIDITLIYEDGSSDFVDVKTGASSLYWTPTEGWYITIKPSFLLSMKRNDAIMHLGPKKDLFVFYDRMRMLDFCRKRLPKALEQDVILYKRHWPDFFRSNLI
jgi:hypothetical protein